MTFEEEFVCRIQDEVKKFNTSNNVIVDDAVQYSNFHKVIVAVRDVLLLVFRLALNSSKKFNIIYTGVGLCQKKEKQYFDRILDADSMENVIYINRGRETIINRVDGCKAYNIGGLVKLVSFFMKHIARKKQSIYFSYKLINDFILGFTHKPNVYSLLYYNLNGLSLLFSKHRNNFKLIEVQHGTIINFPTYSSPSKIKIADVFIVKNHETIDYLKQHLNKNFQDVQYQLLSYPKSEVVFKEGKHILYASTVEFNGIHPVFLEYLKQIEPTENSTIYLRLHPREKNKKDIFIHQLREIKANVNFDESKNWMESNQIKNLIVVSPWSSVIEDAADNGYKTIIIDELGKKRFEHLINNKQSIYANDVLKLVTAINHDI